MFPEFLTSRTIHCHIMFVSETTSQHHSRSYIVCVNVTKLQLPLRSSVSNTVVILMFKPFTLPTQSITVMILSWRSGSLSRSSDPSLSIQNLGIISGSKSSLCLDVNLWYLLETFTTCCHFDRQKSSKLIKLGCRCSTIVRFNHYLVGRFVINTLIIDNDLTQIQDDRIRITPSSSMDIESHHYDVGREHEVL